MYLPLKHEEHVDINRSRKPATENFFHIWVCLTMRSIKKKGSFYEPTIFPTSSCGFKTSPSSKFNKTFMKLTKKHISIPEVQAARPSKTIIIFIKLVISMPLGTCHFATP